MIIDKIWDRKDSGYYDWYDFEDIYNYATSFGFEELARACDLGKNEDVVLHLVNYMKENGYVSDNEKSMELIKWVEQQQWVIEYPSEV
jgi:hypothetical protein